MSGFFSRKEKDRKGALLATSGAIAALPAVHYGQDYLNSSANKLSPSLLNRDTINALKSDILKDPALAEALPIISTAKAQELVTAYEKSKYIPSAKLDSLKDVVRLGGYNSLDGEKIPVSDFIKRVRNAGGYITMGPKSDLADLAHELGHAKALSPNSSRFKNMDAFNILQRLGRSSSRHIAGAAAAASLLQEDPDSPMAYVPAAVAAATQIPVMREEYIASSKGYEGLKNLRKAGLIDDAALSAAKMNYAKGLGTYGLRALGIAAVPALAALARSRFNTEVDVEDSDNDTDQAGDEGLKSVSLPKALGIGALGTAAGVLGAKYLGPSAIEHVAKPLKGYLDDLINKRMARGQVVDEAVESAKRLGRMPSDAPVQYHNHYYGSPYRY
jgi:hypothetical protein